MIDRRPQHTRGHEQCLDFAVGRSELEQNLLAGVCVVIARHAPSPHPARAQTSTTQPYKNWFPLEWMDFDLHLSNARIYVWMRWYWGREIHSCARAAIGRKSRASSICGCKHLFMHHLVVKEDLSLYATIGRKSSLKTMILFPCASQYLTRNSTAASLLGFMIHLGFRIHGLGCRD